MHSQLSAPTYWVTRVLGGAINLRNFYQQPVRHFTRMTMDTSLPPPCQHIGIAHNAMGNVVICPDCGVVRISLEYLTIRLAPEAFRALAQMLNVAQDRIDNFNLGPQMQSEVTHSNPVSTSSTEKIH